ncbi:hypothetical protein QYE76_026011 [Lolium multiflorum]|uniref:F-box domain-containing protein n=1 Tax=Lolium multiflorum TaxID=4521 RepID=A0AAD8VV61_LOLMU|nr:hypothetical protein QYE76_026011 [Lolium multiflorum]
MPEPDGRGATLLEDLPEEIIDNILVRLPSKDVGRCRVVNASWRNATSTPEFMLRHHRRQPSLPIIDGRGMVVALGAGALWPFLPGAKQRDKIRLRGACDGLLAVSWGSRSYLCNPVIRKQALLPQPQDMIGSGQDIESKIIGFYQHHPTGELRVLWISKHLHAYNLYILTVGCDRPRHVELRTASSSPMEDKPLNVLFRSGHFPIVDHGNLHWHPDVTGIQGQLIVFDTEAESFRWMRFPTQLCYNLKLFSMKGSLAVSGSSCCTYTVVDIWVMQDYQAEVWAFKYHIDLSVVEASRQLYLTSFENEKEREPPLDSLVKWINDMDVLNECELLIMCSRKQVLRCGVDGKFLGMVNIGESKYGMELTQLRLEESIVPLLYHAMQGEEEEPFSSEHV